MNHLLSRRSLLVASSATALTAGLATATGATAVAPDRSPGAPLRTNPFTLGIASGDPEPDGMVLWTRLALDPLAEDGLGGMPRRTVPVQWQVATDPLMRRVVARGTELARPESAHSVHVETHGLQPGREYFYRFKAGRHLSEVGRTRTTPAPWEMPAALAMAFASCSQFEHGYFTAYRRLAEDQPDVVLHLGDYIYEYTADTYVIDGGNPRDHRGPETETLANYRQRHAQYKADPDLQAAHAVAPWLVVWDDHEIDNNWADEVYEKPHIPQPNFLQRRAAAMQAYYENMPLRRRSMPQGIDTLLHRRTQWGQLANLHMMDTRQYRDDQACGDGWKTNCTDRLDPARTLTGDAQEQWLLENFQRSTQRWDLLGQQVFFAERDGKVEPELEHHSMDGWDGYTGSRDRITQGWVQAGVRNPVVLTGDVHRHWASDVLADFEGTGPEAEQVVGAELVCSSITSTGDGDAAEVNETMAWNEHIQYYKNQRGYVRTTITPEAMTADFRVLDHVTTPGAAARTDATFRIEDGQRGLQEIAPRA
ncbi:alkaline phosphatase D [Kytococcus aerolatus]|uniref:Alkaline phosphatase D n=1 Tax=Kytococcus aerolatus TaxID=592308 RepID=A0A212TER9_9MICO|nr:alkaline phosphatase D family protein [Kytococcus aerolatus]SNC64316.1 alkaline phosphatase D [Kytococcus aerolatus]